MHIAETLFEPRHGLAIGGETEMPGLYDAGMDRADGNLMEIFPFDWQEVVSKCADQRLLGLAEGMGHAPEAEIEPGAGIGRAYGLEAEQVADRALEPARSRMVRRDRGKLAVAAFVREDSDRARRFLDQRRGAPRPCRPTGRAMSRAPRQVP